jgi:GNAT superfamily N-acetyltransferase
MTYRLGMGISVRRLTSDDWRTLRAVRLAALADAPYAYGSTLVQEQAFTEQVWRDRLDKAGTLWAVAFLDEEPVGMIGAFPTVTTTVTTTVDTVVTTVMLVAMWAHPDHRGRGIGDVLVTDVVRWAAETGWSRVVLRVADGNVAARRLFLRHGFVPTGQRAPLESDPRVGTELLAHAI